MASRHHAINPEGNMEEAKRIVKQQERARRRHNMLVGTPANDLGSRLRLSETTHMSSQGQNVRDSAAAMAALRHTSKVKHVLEDHCTAQVRARKRRGRGAVTSGAFGRGRDDLEFLSSSEDDEEEDLMHMEGHDVGADAAQVLGLGNDSDSDADSDDGKDTRRLSYFSMHPKSQPIDRHTFHLREQTLVEEQEPEDDDGYVRTAQSDTQTSTGPVALDSVLIVQQRGSQDEADTWGQRLAQQERGGDEGEEDTKQHDSAVSKTNRFLDQIARWDSSKVKEDKQREKREALILSHLQREHYRGLKRCLTNAPVATRTVHSIKLVMEDEDSDTDDEDTKPQPVCTCTRFKRVGLHASSCRMFESTIKRHITRGVVRSMLQDIRTCFAVAQPSLVAEISRQASRSASTASTQGTAVEDAASTDHLVHTPTPTHASVQSSVSEGGLRQRKQPTLSRSTTVHDGDTDVVPSRVSSATQSSVTGGSDTATCSSGFGSNESSFELSDMELPHHVASLGLKACRSTFASGIDVSSIEPTSAYPHLNKLSSEELISLAPHVVVDDKTSPVHEGSSAVLGPLLLRLLSLANNTTIVWLTIFLAINIAFFVINYLNSGCAVRSLELNVFLAIRMAMLAVCIFLRFGIGTSISSWHESIAKEKQKVAKIFMSEAKARALALQNGVFHAEDVNTVVSGFAQRIKSRLYIKRQERVQQAKQAMLGKGHTDQGVLDEGESSATPYGSRSDRGAPFPPSMTASSGSHQFDENPDTEQDLPPQATKKTGTGLWMMRWLMLAQRIDIATYYGLLSLEQFHDITSSFKSLLLKIMMVVFFVWDIFGLVFVFALVLQGDSWAQCYSDTVKTTLLLLQIEISIEQFVRICTLIVWALSGNTFKSAILRKLKHLDRSAYYDAPITQTLIHALTYDKYQRTMMASISDLKTKIDSQLLELQLERLNHIQNILVCCLFRRALLHNGNAASKRLRRAAADIGVRTTMQARTQIAYASHEIFSKRLRQYMYYKDHVRKAILNGSIEEYRDWVAPLVASAKHLKQQLLIREVVTYWKSEELQDLAFEYTLETMVEHNETFRQELDELISSLQDPAAFKGLTQLDKTEVEQHFGASEASGAPRQVHEDFDILMGERSQNPADPAPAPSDAPQYSRRYGVTVPNPAPHAVVNTHASTGGATPAPQRQDPVQTPTDMALSASSSSPQTPASPAVHSFLMSLHSSAAEGVAKTTNEVAVHQDRTAVLLRADNDTQVARTLSQQIATIHSSDHEVALVDAQHQAIPSEDAEDPDEATNPCQTSDPILHHEHLSLRRTLSRNSHRASMLQTLRIAQHVLDEVEDDTEMDQAIVYMDTLRSTSSAPACPSPLSHGAAVAAHPNPSFVSIERAASVPSHQAAVTSKSTQPPNPSQPQPQPQPQQQLPLSVAVRNATALRFGGPVPLNLQTPQPQRPPPSDLAEVDDVVEVAVVGGASDGMMTQKIDVDFVSELQPGIPERLGPESRLVQATEHTNGSFGAPMSTSASGLIDFSSAMHPDVPVSTTAGMAKTTASNGTGNAQKLSTQSLAMCDESPDGRSMRIARVESDSSDLTSSSMMSSTDVTPSKRGRKRKKKHRSSKFASDLLALQDALEQTSEV
eukprot:m.336038 g.336038  ORF g.336038 m.336038 type:complete len:1623 (+) comp16078_c0_seq1:259-5127(+)